MNRQPAQTSFALELPRIHSPGTRSGGASIAFSSAICKTAAKLRLLTRACRAIGRLTMPVRAKFWRRASGKRARAASPWAQKEASQLWLSAAHQNFFFRQDGQDEQDWTAWVIGLSIWVLGIDVFLIFGLATRKIIP